MICSSVFLLVDEESLEFKGLKVHIWARLLIPPHDRDICTSINSNYLNITGNPPP